MELRYYRRPGGSEPVREFINALDKRERAKVDAAFTRIGQFGLAESGVQTRPIGGKLWEIKVSATRVFYLLATRQVMVLLHAYKKQSQKAPGREIAIAEARMKEVLYGIH